MTLFSLDVFYTHFLIFASCKWFCAFLYLWNLFVKKKFKTDIITSFILLRTITFICNHLWESLLFVIILWLSLLFVIIYENLFYSWLLAIIYSESLSEPDFNFTINYHQISSFFKSKSESEFGFSLAFTNLDICIFSPHIYTFLNKFADGFFINSHNVINTYASNATIIHILFWYIITQKCWFYHTIKFSYFRFQVFLFENRFAMKFNA